ncbi:hypothetical protein BD324DRAFT_653674 [Kockovaella imperatae]|uniref:Uncharacterized protein n=1 Tax=Kockovaella imperatae TaxID=4999 RepID=A0A1Y1U7J4_9TREE|nr:hypothetical protein BD324DRAFT_653674 [Kockovaella imperatae]ORX33978.1 hypothetical protein BD324DRAFT_653674 [Kockovaella imperatae]
MASDPTRPASVTSLTSQDVRSDPILSSLARKQAPPTAFKARPAPPRQDNVGPRMTKSATLRQGLKPVAPTSSSEERKEVDFKSTPGHKREGLGITVAALSKPSIAPRETKASKLRTGGTVETSAKKDMAAAAAASKAREREEQAKRRASIAVPASLSAPHIIPRTNRSSMLRTGVEGPLVATKSATNIKEDRVKAAYEEKVNRRASVVKSLGAPTIVPRANKSSMLRAPRGGEVPPK